MTVLVADVKHLMKTLFPIAAPLSLIALLIIFASIRLIHTKAVNFQFAQEFIGTVTWIGTKHDPHGKMRWVLAVKDTSGSSIEFSECVIPQNVARMNIGDTIIKRSNDNFATIRSERIMIFKCE